MMQDRRVSISQLTRRLRAADLLVDEAVADVVFTGITDDSRSVTPGDLFCAWSGSSIDAHGYVSAAAEAGAVAALVERPAGDAGIPQVRVRDGRRAAAVAASVFFGEPELSLRLAGVTGTNGKTTTVWMLRHMLSQRVATASLGTLGAILNNGTVLPGSESLTTPGPVDLMRTLRALVDSGIRMVAMEVSSHALDQGRVHMLDFDVAIFTNLSRDHLDYHGTLEQYLVAKRSLVHRLKRDGTAVINADDRAWMGLTREAPSSLTFGVEHDADVRATHVELSATGASFDLHTPDGRAGTTLPLLGDFNVHNALGAAGACLALGFTVHETAESMATIPQVPGRLELISTEPCPVLRDYAHTPDALERVLTTLRPLTSGRLIVVFGAGGDRDRGKRPLMGAIAESHADVVIVTSDNPRTEDPDSIIDEIEGGMTGPHVRITDRAEAIAHALGTAAADDVIVLAGKGHETYQIIGEDRHSFDEREIVAGVLRGAV
ncbi:MAG TPA: UDP-N-acetylmuramoyl-L-alanyl-D-glutamate--2,6-diaminopimelate ligase [Longimicrobiales bacterium]|nr:UDP-N-acetylmuramoyl-L-alanyl-D-glutamate--2,6-diaminopimelate ligase [Longimicrobiales bacterium]